MTYLRRSIGVGCGLAVLCCLVACGSFKQAIEDVTNMQKLGMAYHSYANAADHKSVGPPSADAWAKWAGENGQADVVPLINECKGGGKYTFIWSVKINQPNAGTLILGHENKLPGAQGNVVMADGTVQTMMPAQFTAATKATPHKDDDKKPDDKKP